MITAIGRVQKAPGRGTWEFVVDLPASGHFRRVHRRGFVMKREAQAALDRVRSEWSNGLFADSDTHCPQGHPHTLPPGRERRCLICLILQDP